MAEPFQFFLVADAEALLLVDYYEAELRYGDVFGEQAVRADHDVDFAGR